MQQYRYKDCALKMYPAFFYSEKVFIDLGGDADNLKKAL